jgi:hypothetical protein
MVNKIILSKVAGEEIEESFYWCEESVEGLCVKFMFIIDNAFNSISKNLELFPRKKANIREFSVDEFPFLIVYEYIRKENIMNVLHVFHTARNPKLKYKNK